jgi:peptidyl-prolyl cis-trans isomerase SurA
MILFGNNKAYIIVIVILFFTNLIFSSVAVENKILVKINNEIITSLDIDKESSYLMALNPNIEKLNSKEILTIAKNSLIREKIKQEEILKYIDEIKVEKEYLDRFIKSTYSQLGIKTEDEFIDYINKYDIDIKMVKKKISIEAIWNQVIFSKFSNEIKLDKNELKKRILEIKNKKNKKYLLSEILFNIDVKSDFENKYKAITDSISKIGFENTAGTYSISDSSKIGGKIGWINENSLNDKVKKNLSDLKVGELSKPIITPSGFLILKINNIEFYNKEINIESELKLLEKVEINKQLNQFSNIYFNKIAKNFTINEL